MAEVMDEDTSHWWWLDSHIKASERSPWLQSTLSELDQKTKAMLKLIEENADSFAQRAEMYYKKRPELINMVEEFYRAHRSLAERYDLVKTDHGTRLVTTFGSPFMSFKHHKPEKLVSMANQTYNSYSESSDADEYAKSEVEDPEQEGEIQIENEFEEVEDPELLNEIHEVDEELKEAQVVENPKQEDEIQVAQELKEDSAASDVYIDQIKKLREELETLKEENKKQKCQLEFAEETLKVFVLSEVYIGEIEKLKEEIETLKEENQKRKVQLEVTEESKKDSVLRDVYVSEIEKLWVEIETLKEENKIQKDQLKQKDQEKIQVIRQLSMAVGLLKDENSRLRKHIARETHKKNIPFDLNKVKDSFFGKLFGRSSNSPSTVLPLERL